MMKRAYNWTIKIKCIERKQITKQQQNKNER